MDARLAEAGKSVGRSGASREAQHLFILSGPLLRGGRTPRPALQPRAGTQGNAGLASQSSAPSTAGSPPPPPPTIPAAGAHQDELEEHALVHLCELCIKGLDLILALGSLRSKADGLVRKLTRGCRRGWGTGCG